MIRFLVPALLMIVPVCAQDLPDGPGKETFSKVCSACHGLDLATSQKKSAEEWKATVDKMAGYGAEASDKDFEAIVAYLAKNFGPGEKQAKVQSDAKVQANASPKEMPDGQGKEIILRECTACHLPDHFTKYRHTNEEWQTIVIRMGQRVRSASKEELDIVQ